VSCPNLEFLKLTSLDFQKVWPDEQEVMSCNVQNLKIFIVEGCHNLKYLFLSNMVEKFVQLNVLDISDCKNVEEVIYLERSLEEKQGMAAKTLFPNLETLGLAKLPKLARFCYGNGTVLFPLLINLWIWDCHLFNTFISADYLIGDYQPQIAQQEEGNSLNLDDLSLFSEKVAFPSLKDLRITGMGKWQKIWGKEKIIVDSFCELNFFLVQDCERLFHIFPLKMMERLKKLEEMPILNCDSLEQIVGPSHEVNSSDASNSTAKFVFPKMTVLRLEKLPKLKCFYSNIHTTEWPLLQELRVTGCNKLAETFGENEKLISFLESQGERQIEITFQQHPLFWVSEHTFPNLERLWLGENGIAKDWHRQLRAKYFPKLIWLALVGFTENVFSPLDCFIQYLLPNLETLQVYDSFFKDLFPFEGALARLKELWLFELPELTCLWKEEIPLGQCFSNLSILEVHGCKLENILVPSSVSFKNLTTLQVSTCNGLKNLVTLQTAKSMMLLETMSVTDCQMMKEVIASTSDVVVDEVVFIKLKTLELDSLPSLSRFCSGNCTFGFPSLEKVLMKQCPQLQIFCEGELNTPMLKGVESTEGECVERWEGDLNATIRQLFVEKVALPCLKESSITGATSSQPTP
ncbi:disease resistance protein, partial [Corchorus olitorius]